ncbi:twin-arginine translocase subunit TatC [Haloparvum sp. PAK95]|uniref:twin-arginine translocase subunit TatC n=1 Tax=Haloparvum sp. PAK95 TaxID=3418962 RepID=UPI003D2F4024
MSSALDEDTQQTLAEGQETARTFLRSVQKDLQKVFVVFLVGFIGTFYALRLYIWDALKGVTRANMPPEIAKELEIIAQTPFEVILLQAKIGMIIGGLFAVPPLIYFGRDGLKERDMWPTSPVSPWKIAIIAVMAVVLFTVGAAYGYLVFFPVMFNFLASFGLDAGFNPSYSIVMWTEFIVFLSLSFGLAGQMPLLITGLSYAEIVPYETFRDKWRHAVVAIFVFGAMFSPPDPFTQIMWAVPLIGLYGFSLYLAKVVVTARRSSDQIDVLASIREYWNVVAGALLLGGAAVYAFYRYGGRTAANDALRALGTTRRFLPAGEGIGVAPTVAVGLYATMAALFCALLAVLYVVYRDLEMRAPPGQQELGDPTAIDVGNLDAAGVRAAPPQAFVDMSEEESLKLAEAAMDADDPEKAQAILDRFDEVQEAVEAGELGDEGEAAEGEGAAGESAEAVPESATGAGDAASEGGGVTEDVGDRASRASETFLDGIMDEDEEADIGGYYTDLRFIADSLRSGAFRIVAVFMAVMASTFTWMYLGGLGDVRRDFISRVPSELDTSSFTVITLHPVEALIFMVKFSVLAGILAALPVIAYHAWPALRERGFVRGHQRQVYVWTGSLAAALVGGFVLGYLYIAPGLISYLVTDALNADMLITYRINDFFWLIIFTTIGIGLLADIPVLMVLLNSAGVPYDALRNRWREVTIAMLTFAAIFTPADILTMFLVTVPLMAAYGVGIGVLFLVTLGGRRDLAPPADFITDEDGIRSKVEDRV